MDDKLSSFYLVYKSSPSFWSNYSKSCSWLQDQGFKPIASPFKCPIRPSHNQFAEGSSSSSYGQVDVNDSDLVPGTISNDGESQSTQSEGIVDDDYIRFILETRKHQKERAQLKAERKKKEENEEIIYRDICDIDQQRLMGSTSSPESSRSKHNSLYGSESDTIMAKETLIQSDFNVYCDTHKPRFWPIIPIRI